MTATQQPDPFGAPPPRAKGPSGPRAGFWKRAWAILLDGLIIVVVAQLLRGIDRELADFLVLPGGLVYFALLEGGTRGQTLGKRVFGIRVIDLARGGPIGTGRGFIRNIVRLLSWMAFGLGYLWMLWDREKQTWHDKAAGTVVVPFDSYPVG
jgi:uncharacterized RDD family membrane protein YckC